MAADAPQLQNMLDELDQLLAISQALRTEARYWRYASTLSREELTRLHQQIAHCQQRNAALRVAVSTLTASPDQVVRAVRSSVASGGHPGSRWGRPPLARYTELGATQLALTAASCTYPPPARCVTEERIRINRTT
jgi:hypothetical protein